MSIMWMRTKIRRIEKMENNQRKMERELQKALAIEYVKEYCNKNKFSVEKLRSQRFTLIGNECAFEYVNDAEAEEYIIDGGTKNQITLVIRYENQKLHIEETEYTKKFLSIEMGQ